MGKSHYGIARYVITGDRELGESYIPRGKKLLAGLLKRMKLGGLDTGAATLRIDGDSYVIARVAGGVNIVNIVAGAVSAYAEDARADDGLPDFISGVATGRTIETVKQSDGSNKRVIEDFYPTVATSKTHPYLTPESPQAVEQLAVPPHKSLGYKRMNDTGTVEYSQYYYISPSMFTGRMKGLVQAVAGFGRLLPRQGVDPVKFESGDKVPVRKSKSIYAEAYRAVYELGSDDLKKNYLSTRTTSYNAERAREGLQIQYDHRFNRTHGLVKTGAGKFWLVEISQTNGVLVRPLPLDPLTVQLDNDKWPFRELLEELNLPGTPPGETVRDEDGLHLLDEFGGFPTGESMPPSKYMQEYIRAGEVARLLRASDMAGFYKNLPYTSAQGWAFNESGTEAHNTGYRFGDDGIQVGSHYYVELNLGEPFEREPSGAARALAKRARSAASPDLKALYYKKGLRVEESQAEALLAIADGDAFREAFSALEVTPVCGGSAALQFVADGPLFTKNAKNYQPQQFKPFEPLMNQCISHDFRPSAGYVQRGNNPDCDTPMWVFFDRDDLKWVRFFRESRESNSDEEQNDDDECRLIGTFTDHKEYGPRGIPDGFYSSEFDDRRQMSNSTRTTTTTSQYLGPTICQYGDEIHDIRRNFLIRTHTFLKSTHTVVVNEPDYHTAVSTPKGVREAYYYAKFDIATRREEWTSQSIGQMRDPYSYTGWRCIVSTMGFAGWPEDMEECPPGCETIRGAPVPGSYNPRVVREEHYNPYECSDVIDQGPYAAKCAVMEDLAYRVPPPPLAEPTYKRTDNVGDYEMRMVIAHAPRVQTTNTLHFEQDYLPALTPFWPNPWEGSLSGHNVNASFSALGHTESAIYDRDMAPARFQDGGETFRIYGPLKHAEMTPGKTVYIGVI